MISEGAIYRCQSCQTEVEVISASQAGGPFVCCEIEMKAVGDEFEKLWEREAYDVMDYQWD